MKYLKNYNKLFEGNAWLDKSCDNIIDDIIDILRDCDDIGLDVECRESSQLYINILDAEVVGLRVALYSKYSKVIQFINIKDNIEHLINYMKSIGYSNFYYKDDESNFNIHNRRADSDLKGKINYLPIDTDVVSHVSITFIKDGLGIIQKIGQSYTYK